ncbi:MAG: hypothetical protein WBM34_07000 [Woeseiaceae bacterium]
MIRLLGILTGSAIAVGFLIITLGLPEFPATPVEPLPRYEPALEEAGPLMVDVLSVEKPSATNESEQDDDVLADEQPATGVETLVETLVENTTAPVPPVQPIPPADDSRWYSFWSPFRSEIAADGFVAELQRTTGMDFRVVKIKPGVYEVAFAYLDESDIKEKLTRISSATGLDMSDG